MPLTAIAFINVDFPEAFEPVIKLSFIIAPVFFTGDVTYINQKQNIEIFDKDLQFSPGFNSGFRKLAFQRFEYVVELSYIGYNWQGFRAFYAAQLPAAA